MVRKIELHEDAVVISGWTWSGPVEETIPLKTITAFEKWITPKGQNFCFVRNGEPLIRGRIERGAELRALELKNDENIELKRRH